MPLINPRVIVSLRSTHSNFNFAINKQKTLADLRKQILLKDEKGAQISQINFRTNEGINISSQTGFSDLNCFDAISLDIYYKNTPMQRFNMLTIDETTNSATVNLDPSQKTEYDFLVDNGMCAKEAVSLSQFSSNLQNMLMLSSATVTNMQLISMIKEALTIQGTSVKKEREQLQRQLRHLKEKINPYQNLETKSKAKGQQKARRALGAFTSIICAQFAFSQWGTYLAYSWDIIEPITCLFTMADATLAYFFWSMTGKTWTLHGLEMHFAAKTMQKEIKLKKNADEESFENAKNTIKVIEKRLKELE